MPIYLVNWNILTKMKRYICFGKVIISSRSLFVVTYQESKRDVKDWKKKYKYNFHAGKVSGQWACHSRRCSLGWQGSPGQGCRWLWKRSCWKFARHSSAWSLSRAALLPPHLSWRHCHLSLTWTRLLGFSCLLRNCLHCCWGVSRRWCNKWLNIKSCWFWWRKTQLQHLSDSCLKLHQH